MKKACVLAVSLLFFTFSISAQVSVEVTMDQDQFLRGEAIKTAVKITNLSGRVLHLGAEDDWLTFTLESKDGGVVPRLADVPVKGEFVLESARRATKRVNLEPFFGLTDPGRYSVVANVHLKELDMDRKSEPKPFFVIEGAKLWEQDFGVPKAAGATNEVPEVRKYALQQANYVKGQLRLYLRVSDQSGGVIFRTVPIGTMLSFSRPEVQIDKVSNLHLIYQSWARAFTYAMFNPNGELLNREVYDYVDSRPRLHVEGEGEVSVLGGVKRASEPPSALSQPPTDDLQAAHP